MVFDLPGGSFAFVMATGIVSLAAMRLGYDEVAAALFAVNLAAFPLLCVLMLVRLIRHPAAILSELRNHRSGPGFLTAVAATSIFGDQLILFASNSEFAAALWLASLVLWVGLIYAFFVAVTIKPVKPPLARGLDGAWLLTVVATESVAILATHVEDVFSRPDIVVFYQPVLIPVGRCPLSNLDFFDCSALAVRADAARAANAALLDQHGRGGDHDPGGSAPSIDCRCPSADGGARPADRGGDRAVLGDRHLVGSVAGSAFHVAPRRAPDSSNIQVGILVHRVSARHVHGGDLGVVAPKRRRVSRGNTARMLLDRIGFLDLRRCRNDTASVVPAAPSTEELRTC